MIEISKVKVKRINKQELYDFVLKFIRGEMSIIATQKAKSDSHKNKLLIFNTSTEITLLESNAFDLSTHDYREEGKILIKNLREIYKMKKLSL